MACSSCKKKKAPKVGKIVSDEKTLTTGKKIRNYFFNSVLFIILISIIVPISIPLIIYVLFKTTVLEKRINVFPLLLFIGKKIVSKFDDEYDDEDDEDDDEENEEWNETKYDYELENPNDVVIVKDK